MISEKPANWGDTVTATCTMLKGDSPIQIEWALNGEPISHDYSDISIATSRRVSLLTIDAVTASHAGEYTCMASNAAGGTSFTATLAVNGTIRVPYSPFSLLYFLDACTILGQIASLCTRFPFPSSTVSVIVPFLIPLVAFFLFQKRITSLSLIGYPADKFVILRKGRSICH